MQQAEADFDPLRFDASAARAVGRVTASLHRAGCKPAARAYDATITAVAIGNDLLLYTCNPDDSSDIDDLDVVVVLEDVECRPDREVCHGGGERARH